MATMWGVNITNDEWTQVGTHIGGTGEDLVVGCPLPFEFLAVVNLRVPADNAIGIYQEAGNTVRVVCTPYEVGGVERFDRFYIRLRETARQTITATVWTAEADAPRADDNAIDFGRTP